MNDEYDSYWQGVYVAVPEADKGCDRDIGGGGGGGRRKNGDGCGIYCKNNKSTNYCPSVTEYHVKYHRPQEYDPLLYNCWWRKYQKTGGYG